MYLRIVGIGYRASLSEQTLTFKLGYSHDVTYELPGSMRAFLPEPTLVGLYGIDKNQVSIILWLQLLQPILHVSMPCAMLLIVNRFRPHDMRVTLLIKLLLLGGTAASHLPCTADL